MRYTKYSIYLVIKWWFLGAAQRGNTDELKDLYKRAQTLNMTDQVMDVQDELGSTPLIVASSDGYLSTVKILIQKGSRIDAARKDGKHAAFLAAQNGHVDAMKLLIQKSPYVADLKGYEGRTPLAAASIEGHLMIVKYLLSLPQTIIDSQDNNGSTPLILAAYNNHPDVVQLLLEKGASKRPNNHF